MKSIVRKRIFVSLTILSTASLPVFFPMACLSGAEQEAIANAWFQTTTGMAADGLIASVPQNLTGNALIDTAINGAVAWAVGLTQLTVNGWHGRQVDHHIPNDPFP